MAINKVDSKFDRKSFGMANVSSLVNTWVANQSQGSTQKIEIAKNLRRTESGSRNLVTRGHISRLLSNNKNNWEQFLYDEDNTNYDDRQLNEPSGRKLDSSLHSISQK